MNYLTLSAPANLIAWARTLVTQLTQRDTAIDTTLGGLGTMATQDANAVAITGGSVTSLGAFSVTAGGGSAVIGAYNGSTQYRLISVSASFTNAGLAGLIYASPGVDPNLYVQVPTGGKIVLRVGATAVMSVDGSGNVRALGTFTPSVTP